MRNPWRWARGKRLRIGREGFTLMEAMIIVTVIAILAALSVVRSDVPRSRAAAATLQSDLRNLGSAQEAYYSAHLAYAADVSTPDHEAVRARAVADRLDEAFAPPPHSIEHDMAVDQTFEY